MKPARLAKVVQRDRRCERVKREQVRDERSGTKQHFHSSGI